MGLAELRADFEQAARAAGVTERRLELAGRAVSIRFAGSAAADALAAAFSHLDAAPGDEAALTLRVWDSATAAVGRPSLAPRRQPRGEREHTGAGPSYFYEDASFRALHQPAIDALSVLNADADSGWFWVPDAGGLPYWEYTAPFRHLLNWWLGSRGHRYVHGAAVGMASGGVLLVGPGGSGKSTTALSVLAEGRLRFAGDDYVAVGRDGEPFIHSLYSSAKVHRADVQRLPHLAPALEREEPTQAKVVVDVAKLFPDRCIAGFPLRAVVVPRITDRRAARVVPGTHAAALRALAPSTIFQLHPPEPDALARMADLIRTVPTFSLELGTAAQTIPPALVDLLDELA
jgi:hypothetical protein